MSLDERLLILLNGQVAKNWFLDLLMVGIARLGIWVFVIALACIFLKDWKIFFKAVISALLSWGINYTIGVLHFRPRPFITHDVHLLISHICDKSFPSDHAAISFSLALIIFLKDKRLGMFLLVLAGFISIARVFCGLHYPLDVVTGGLVGLCTAWMVNLFSIKALRRFL